MADIRIKDLATTASVTASDDFMAVDGAINGTRKLSAATPSFLTSVTTPSLTSPASTNLTLGLGTGGTALTLASSTLEATFAGNVITGDVISLGSLGSIATSAYRGISFTNSLTSAQYAIYKPAGVWTQPLHISFFTGIKIGADTTYGGTKFYSSTDMATELMSVGDNGNNVKIASTTAGSSGAGALIVQGGISAGNTGSAASYFGGAVTTNGAGSTNYGSTNSTLILNRASASAGNFVRFQGTAAYDTYIGTIGTAAGIAPTADTFVIGRDGNAPTFALVPSTGAATFAGAVTITGALKLGNAYVGTPVVSTGYITIQDNTGTTYKVAVSL